MRSTCPTCTRTTSPQGRSRSCSPTSRPSEAPTHALRSDQSLTPSCGKSICAYTHLSPCRELTRNDSRFCGLTRSQPGSLTVLETESPYWIYRYERADRPGTWTPILPIEQSHRPRSSFGPQARYAHQVVYDTSGKVVYMHGGNNGIVMDDGNKCPHAESDTERGRPVLDGGDATKENRLDDFWKMALERYVALTHIILVHRSHYVGSLRKISYGKRSMSSGNNSKR